MAGLFSLLFLIALTLLVIGLLKPSFISRLTKQTYDRKKVSFHFGLATLILFVITSAPVDGKPSVQEPSSAASVDVAKATTSPSISATVATAPSSSTIVTQERIREIVSEVGGLLAITYDKDNNMVMDQSENPPYAVTINTSASDIKDCFDAKSKLFELSKRLYSDPALGSKISRVKFTAWKQLRASIGSADAKDLNWKDLGPTNFWRTTLQYKGYEDETGDLAKRTWGVAINPGCK